MTSIKQVSGSVSKANSPGQNHILCACVFIFVRVKKAKASLHIEFVVCAQEVFLMVKEPSVRFSNTSQRKSELASKFV